MADYIKFNEAVINELKTGSEIRGRGRKQRGGNVMFFNDVNQLLKKLELIIGEVLAGNNYNEKYGSQYIGHIIENVNNQ